VSSAREAILARVRAGLSGARVPPLPSVRTGAGVPESERVARFAGLLERVGARLVRVADPAAAGLELARLCAENGVRALVASDAPLLAPLLAVLPPELRRLAPDAQRVELFACELGLSSAQWGIAETGTLVLESAIERHRLASLLPPRHVAVLARSRLLGTLGEAFAAVRAGAGTPASRTITFVTGPSRTADIELELVVGVHGPKHLTVLLLDSA
jgi:L-lactate dehydrogenase complex protein LldG